MTFNLNGRKFSPIANSEGGRVDETTLFTFSQIGRNFSAIYTGANVSDGHLIGRFQEDAKITLLYHSRAKTGELEAGSAVADVTRTPNGKLTLDMQWEWLNASQKTGRSKYLEVTPTEQNKSE